MQLTSKDIPALGKLMVECDVRGDDCYLKNVYAPMPLSRNDMDDVTDLYRDVNGEELCKVILEYWLQHGEQIEKDAHGDEACDKARDMEESA